MNRAERMSKRCRRERRLDGTRELLVGIVGARFGPCMPQMLATYWLESVSVTHELKQVGDWREAGMSGDTPLAKLRHC